MISEEIMEEIAKQTVNGKRTTCPSCGATLVVKNDFHNFSTSSLQRTFVAICLNCGEYGEVTFHLGKDR